MNNSNNAKVAIVTGASRGIGKAIAFKLGREGYRVVVHYKSSEKAAEEIVESIRAEGGTALLYQANVAHSGEVNAMIQWVIRQWGGIDILVNNSGIMIDRWVEDISDEEWDELIAVNLNSVFYTCRAVIPHFKQKQVGRIINISSQAALTGSAQHAHYAAAKSALLGFSYSLAKELGPYGITVNVVSPGRIVTDMITSRENNRTDEWISQTPLRRLGQPEDVADAVAFLASDQASYITGLNMHVNGGLVMG
ncbi:MAG: 3-oxoacyl-[acyl-carrier protein] reductase [Paenibacillaceae bacterium]|nr:3-oxoacyl-[acyl-carrier protein] reductase [Paenibacillaceae bacterium]